MLELNKSSYMILGLLSKSSLSGYALKQIIAKTSAFYWSESNAQIYPVLKQLEQQGLVKSRIDIASGARNKKIFTITAAGRQELMAWLKKDFDLTIYRDDFLLQFSLGQHLTKNELNKKIEHYQKSILSKLEKHAMVVEHLKMDHAGKKDQFYLLSVYDLIKLMLEAKLEWCNMIRKKL